jgi:thiosulfate dehydrogenase
MKLILYSLSVVMILSVCMTRQVRAEALDYSPVQYESKSFTEDMRISRGGQLYDNWWKATVNGKKPEEDQQLWKLQNSNKRSGYSTYRCKECHGWDYRGTEGAYSKGSHYTGFIGVDNASGNMSVKELESALRGSTSGDHDFSAYLDNEEIKDLALFLKYGIVDLVRFINTDGSLTGGDIQAGQTFFTTNCMTECHGPDGMAINFGSKDKPEFIGTLSNKNPWEFFHKVRAGQPGTRMSSGIINKWSNEEILDVLAYARTLPREKPGVGWFEGLLNAVGLGKEKESIIPESHRGFGPKIKQ